MTTVAVEVRVGSAAASQMRSSVGGFSLCWLSEQVSELQLCIAHIPRVLFLALRVTRVGGREVWEPRMQCAQGSTPRIHLSNLLIETNASLSLQQCSLLRNLSAAHCVVLGGDKANSWPP